MEEQRTVQLIRDLWLVIETAAVAAEDPEMTEFCPSTEEALREMEERDQEEDDALGVPHERVEPEAEEERVAGERIQMRNALLMSLVRLGAEATALTLIASVDDTEGLRSIFLHELIKGLMQIRGRRSALATWEKAPFDSEETRFMALLEILSAWHPDDLERAREMAERVDDQQQPDTKVLRYVSLFRVRRQNADLERAREVCRQIPKPYFSARGYVAIAIATGRASDYLVAFQHLGRIKGREAQVGQMRPLISAISRQANPEPASVSDDRPPLTRAEVMHILENIQNLRWRKAISRKLREIGFFGSA